MPAKQPCQDVKIERGGEGVALLILNRPERLNAMSRQIRGRSSTASAAQLLARKPREAMRQDKRWLRQLLVDKLGVSNAFGRTAQESAFETRQPQAEMEDFRAGRPLGRSN